MLRRCQDAPGGGLRGSSPPRRIAVWGGLSTAAVLPFLLAFTTPVRAQDEPVFEPRVNYVYATQFGFGGYRVGGLRTDVYSLPIAFTLENVLRSWDLQIALPISYGRFRFSDGVDANGENFFVRAETNTLAIEPKLQLDIPIPAIPGLCLSPLGAFGFGGTFATEASVQENGVKTKIPIDEDGFYTYQIGLSSVLRLPWNDFTFLLGNAFIYAGDASFDGADETVEGYGTFRSGIEGRYPLGFRIADVIPDAGVFFVYNLFTPSLQFTRTGRRSLEIDQIFEIGGTIGLAEPYEISWAPEMLNHPSTTSASESAIRPARISTACA